MKTHSKAVIVGRSIRVWMWCLVTLPLFWSTTLSGKTVYTSTGGTSGTPLNWSNSGTWSVVGTGAPRNYVIRSGDYVFFDTNNVAPFIDTVFVYGHLIMNNNVSMTFTSIGAIGIMGNGSSISGGSNNSLFVWNGSLAFISGPFTASNIITSGPRYASSASALAAGGAAQPSFVAGTLPISLISFQAYCAAGEITIEWRTAMENNSDRFEILMSMDNENWEILGSVAAAGESYAPKSYSYRLTVERAEPSNGPTASQNYHYFRLKSIDKNATYSISETIVSQCSRPPESAGISVSPNPGSGTQVLSVTVAQPGEMEVDVYSEDGKLWKNHRVTGEFTDQVFSFVLQDMDPGIYRVRVVSSNVIKSSTFVKL